MHDELNAKSYENCMKHSMVLELEDDARLSNGGVRVARRDGAGTVDVAAPDDEVRRLLAGFAGQEDVDLGPDPERRRLHDGEEQVPPAGAVPLNTSHLAPPSTGESSTCLNCRLRRHFSN